MNKEGRTEEVEMTLAEIADFYDRDMEFSGSSVYKNPFTSVFSFKPYGFAEIISKKREGILSHHGYSNGRLYLIRKVKAFIEIAPAISRPSDKIWMSKPGRSINRDIGFSDFVSPAWVFRGDFAPPFFSDRGYFSAIHFVPEGGSDDEYKLTLKEDGNATLEEIRKLPAFRKGEYQERLRFGNPHSAKFLEDKDSRFYLVSPEHLSKHWELFLPVMNIYGCCFERFFDGKASRPDIGEVSLLGRMNAPPLGGETLDGCLLQEYAQPKDIGNGVITMAQDRIPLYLQRRLGLGEKNGG